MPEWLVLLILLMIGGAISGLLAGLFGVGGGAIMVIVLYELFGFLEITQAYRMHLSVGTSLAIIVFTTLRSFHTHYRLGAVDVQTLKKWVLPIFCGVICAALIVAHISGDALRMVFATISLAIGLKMIFKVRKIRLGDDMPKGALHAIYGFMIGVLAPIMGIGGGIFCNTIMTLYNRPVHQCVATAAGVSAAVSIPGTLAMMIAGSGTPGLGEFTIGFVYLPAVLLIIPITAGIAPLGATLAHACPSRYLEMALGAFLLIIAGRFIIASLL